MEISIDWKATLIGLAIVTFVAGVSTYFFDIGFWLAFAIVGVALFINGVVSEIEDRSPDGFLNPKDEERKS